MRKEAAREAPVAEGALVEEPCGRRSQAPVAHREWVEAEQRARRGTGLGSLAQRSMHAGVRCYKYG